MDKVFRLSGLLVCIDEKGEVLHILQDRRKWTKDRWTTRMTRPQMTEIDPLVQEFKAANDKRTVT